MTYASFVPASQVSTLIREGGHRLLSFIWFLSTRHFQKFLEFFCSFRSIPVCIIKNKCQNIIYFFLPSGILVF